MPIQSFDRMKEKINKWVPTYRDSTFWLRAGGIAFCLGLLSYHARMLWIYGVDIPFYDEWYHLPVNFSLDWLFRPDNEHRMVPTKILIWALYKLNGWNMMTQVFINLALFALMLVLIDKFIEATNSQFPRWVTPWFLIFMLIPSNAESHYWAIMTASHLWLILLILAVFCLFDQSQVWPRLLLGALLVASMIYNHAGGLVSAVVLLGSFFLFKIMRMVQVPSSFKREAAQFLFLFFLNVLAIAWWVAHYQRPAKHPPFVWPSDLLFWGHYVNLISWGFGAGSRSLLLGWICLMAVVAPLYSFPSRANSLNRTQLWRSGVLTLAILGALMSISLSRALKGFGQAKSDRYLEFVMMLMPLAASHWMVLFEKRKVLGYGAVLVIWLFCFSNFSNKWTGEKKYRGERARRIRTWHAAEKYYFGNPARYRPLVFFQPRASQLETAKRLNLSFYRRMIKSRRPAS